MDNEKTKVVYVDNSDTPNNTAEDIPIVANEAYIIDGGEGSKSPTRSSSKSPTRSRSKSPTRSKSNSPTRSRSSTRSKSNSPARSKSSTRSKSNSPARSECSSKDSYGSSNDIVDYFHTNMNEMMRTLKSINEQMILLNKNLSPNQTKPPQE